ncbi:MAG: peptidoglycan-binding protein, partial [Eubacteriales bacterium]|nr:peptidoglycan-binding protein [Eubacteriales bacterium]
SIITDELLSAPTDLPEVTHSRLPSEWRGFGLSQHKCRSIYSEFKESEFAFLEENGFNFARVFFGFNYLRYPDYPKDTNLINETELRDLDQLIAWGIEHGVHIQLSMCETPGGYSSLEIDDTEWDYIQAYWEALARRYAGIPSRYLTFDLFNEMQPGYETDRVQHGLGRLEKLVTGLRKIDSERVLLTSFSSNPAPQWMEGTARLGLSLGCHPYAPVYLTNGDSSIFRKPAQVSYPYPYFPQWLYKGESLVIEGEIGGKVLWVDMWENHSFHVSFNSGESTDYVSSQMGGRSEQPIEIMIPDGVTRLDLTPMEIDISFLQIGIQSGLDSETPRSSNENYLVPHDLWDAGCYGGAYLFWDSESGFSSERNCSPEFVYEHLIVPQLEMAEKYGVGLMVNEMGTFAACCGWDADIKIDFDSAILDMLEEHDISWAMCELGYIVRTFPGEAPLWENAQWESETYTFEDGHRETITYSPEMLNVYKEYPVLVEDVKPASSSDPLPRNDAAAPAPDSHYDELKKGDKGEKVKDLQEALISKGYLSEKADGIFGKNTQTAVKEFQKANGMKATGIADDATQQLLFKS